MDHFAYSWLAIQCKIIGECHCALLLMVKPETHILSPIAQWPTDMKDPPHQLLTVAQSALETRKNVITESIPDPREPTLAHDYLAVPIVINTNISGVIAVKLDRRRIHSTQEIFTLLEQGQLWLELAGTDRRIEFSKDFYTTVVKLAATCLEQPSYHEALIALISEINKHFLCDRVAIGIIKHKHAEIIAFSNSTKFDKRANLMRCIADAMDEAVDQDTMIIYPVPADQPHYQVTLAHAELANKYGTGAIYTLPLSNQDEIVAVITLERQASNPFDPESVRLIEQTMALLCPYLQLKQTEESPLITKIYHWLNKKLKNLVNVEQIGLKILGLLIVLSIFATSVIHGEFKVHADAVLEGKIQRVITAPMEGYVLTAYARAGDTVTQGMVLATMDDADLKLQSVKLNSEQQQTAREYREALSNRNLAKISVLNAKLEQIEAQQQLVQEQLQRTNIVAPFDGVIIEGDLSQLLGAPVERGKSLFKIAPLDGYRIILKINERLISHVAEGQSGTLSLSGIPEKLFPLTVQKITTISKVENGENIFRAEASLQNPSELLRPGMSGVGKIKAGSKTLLWIWTHDLVDWLSLWLWSWWP